MTPEEFRQAGHAAVDWIADYLERVEELPVQSKVEPYWVRRQLPDTAPTKAEDFDTILADLDRVVVPALLHWQSPNFFGYFPANNSGPSILGEMISVVANMMADQGDPIGVEVRPYISIKFWIHFPHRFH